MRTWRTYATTQKKPAADVALLTIPSELIDQIVKGPMSVTGK